MMLVPKLDAALLALDPSALKAGLQASIARRLLTLPEPMVRRLAGELPRRADGVELDPVTALALRLHALSRRPSLESLSPVEARRELSANTAATELEPAPLARVDDVMFPGRAGLLSARIYRPTEADVSPALLFFHGGGYVVGDLDAYDPLCRFLARELDAIVVSASYRLAPEHPFPAAIEDGVAAVRWLRDAAPSLGVDPARIAVGGDSAGGNLATVVARLVKDEAPRLAAQMLLYPATDMTRSMRSHETFATGFYLTKSLTAWFRGQYVQTPELLAHPDASPYFSNDLAGSPPAIVAVAGFDPLYDEGVAYAGRLVAAGVRTEVVDAPRLIHGFASMAGVVPAARATLLDVVARVRRTLVPSAS
ncbi:alpha/beta hydrolase [Myxococcota bacterium]|nr:alpha/beta hydrolase [Myxococcota bacterium]